MATVSNTSLIDRTRRRVPRLPHCSPWATPMLAGPALFVPIVIATFMLLSLLGSPPAVAATCWSPPVTAPVSDPFRRPECTWCAGNRGIEYATAPGEPVTAVAAGVVTFVGPVAGTTYVVVQHVDGLRATYGNLATTTVGTGGTVVTGAVVGTTAGPFHFGLRDGDEYIDPTPFLGYWAGRPRLVPLDGSPPRPAPPPVLRCGTRPPRL